MAKGRLYSEEEDKQLREMFAKRVSARSMAVLLNRSIMSVQGRLNILGLTRLNKPWHWGAEDDEKLSSLFVAQVPVGEIATALDRTISAVRKRAFDLGLSRDSRRTRLAQRYGVQVLTDGKSPSAIIAEIREKEEQEREAKNAERQQEINALLDEMERGIAAGCDRAFMFTAALVSGATLQAIGDRVGITRERVRQIIELRSQRNPESSVQPLQLVKG